VFESLLDKVFIYNLPYASRRHILVTTWIHLGDVADNLTWNEILNRPYDWSIDG
jgi:hypothetical protein